MTRRPAPTGADPRAGSWRRALPSLALALLVLAVYAPVWHYQFVNWDDEHYVTDNVQVLSGLNWSTLRWAFSFGHPPYWHPLTWLSHVLDVEIWGLNAGGHHLTSVLIHVASTLLIFSVFRQMTGSLWKSWFVAALFGVHPLHVESVAWIAERKDVLSTLFWVLGVRAYVKYVQTPSARTYASIVVFFALGLMSKPMVVTFPLVLLLLDVWPLRRREAGFRSPPGQTGSPSTPQETGLPSPLQRTGFPPTPQETRSVAVWRLVYEKWPLFLLALLSSVVTYVGQARVGAVVSTDVFTWPLRLANALMSYVKYLGSLVWPVGLAPLYPYSMTVPPWWLLAGAALLLLAASIVAALAIRRRPYVFTGWFWYVVTLIPVIGLVQVGDQALADRFTYVPLIGIFCIVAWGVPELMRAAGAARALPVLAALAVGASAVVARQQLSYWSDSATLWRRTIAVTHDNARAHENLGITLEDQAQLDAALESFREAARLRPRSPVAHEHMGLIHLRQGRLPDAIRSFQTAVLLDPEAPMAHSNLASALVSAGRVNEAVTHFQTAIRLDASLAAAHNGLAGALMMSNRLDEAGSHYRQAIKLQPGLAEAHTGLGATLARQGRFDEAIAEYNEALRLDPNLASAHAYLGVAQGAKGNLDAAIQSLLRALEIEPNRTIWRYTVATFLDQQGLREAAILQLQAALTIDPGFRDAREALQTLRSAPNRRAP